jgi:hypothetical protein
MKLGEELPFITALSFAGRGQIYAPRTYNVIAGSYLAVNAYAGSVSPARLQAVKARLEQTKAALASTDQAQIGALSREALLGDLFHAGGLSYYAQLIALSHIMGLQTGGHQTLAAGTGTFGYEPNVNYLFGFPKSIKPGGVVFDIPLVKINATDDGNADQLKQFTLQTGLLSSVLEHAVPEQIFLTDPDNPPDAVSAVKALQKATQQGQRIYHITPSNNTTALPNIHQHPDTMAEISNALNAGKEVITHTDAISVPGWTGAGYIILDPQTGDGSYKIGGGANGGQSSEVGALDFMHAIVGQPGLLFPKCSLPFIEQVVENFFNTNKAIIGLTAPPGVTFITGGAVAAAAGGFTLVTAIKLSIKNPGFLVGNLATAILISMLNYALVSLVYEIGVLIGSTISAAFCRREN